MANREAGREALTEVLIGQPLSHEMFIYPSADVILYAEGNTAQCAIASTAWTRRGHRTWHVNTISTREPGDLSFDRQRQNYRRSASGN